ncbi:MAG: DUF881 domain-containing protein [Acidaminococcus sp.]|jgi:uncharacterized protein YlxW (UPF0749 family)|nr:DUF881 domain-containing protein [Acidaminococcus sp.]MCI2100139.1 DUF881 domain-containing protein [Acidaminococcus sp.]MCI2114458.1 DUF881 domain-containing protein [Acidaminococcus sp.]MCI2116393.1 DUF881 domain-containing protein [Acidaminococcus sp.]
MHYKDRKEKFFTFLVCLVLGVMVSTQFRSAEHARQSINQQRAEDLVEKLKTTEKENKELQERLKQLAKEQAGSADAKTIQNLKMYAGETALHGPGVTVTLNDSPLPTKKGEDPNLHVIHDDDLLRILNELRAGGAEAIALNDERILDVSEVRCAGPTVSVNNTRFSPPYIIRAIGDPKTMESALRLRGGVVETLKFWGIDVDVKQESDITIPAYKGTRHYEYAKPKEGGES